MKNRYILLLSIILLGNVSCKKFLDTQPQDFLSPLNYYKTEQHLNSALNGVYDILGSVYGTVYLYRMGIEGEEGYYARTTPATGPQIYNFSASHSDVQAFWRNLYAGIYRANVLLANVDNNPALSEDLRKKVRGEALFLRGYYYFMLVHSFGGVPLILEPTSSPDDVEVPRSTAKEVYEQILLDMKEAETLVDPIQTIGFGGRVSKSAVRGILARVCLFMAGHPVRDLSKFAEARDWAKKVIDDPTHSLNPDYSQVFINLASDKYDIKESIFEVEFWGNRSDAFTETGYVGYVNGPASSNPATGAVYGGVKVTNRLYQKFAATDLRRDWNIATFTYTSSGANGTKTYYSPLTPDNKTIYNRHCGKFRREYEIPTPKSNSQTPQNFPLLRYSDVLLMYAEAENEVNQGPTPDAYEKINQVRRRGYGKLVTGATNIGEYDLKDLDYTSFRDEVRDERSRELAFEQLRKGDLIRWGIFVSTMNAVGREIEQAGVPSAYFLERFTNVTDKHLFWPIPSYEITLNSALVQNPQW